MKIQFEEKVATSESKLEDLIVHSRQTISRMKQNIDSHKADAEKYRMQAEHIEKEKSTIIHEAERNRCEWEEQLAALNLELELVRSQLADLKTKEQESETKINSLSTSYEETKAALARQKKSAEEEENWYREDALKVRAQLESAHADLNTIKSEYAEIKNILSKKREEADILRHELSELQEKAALGRNHALTENARSLDDLRSQLTAAQVARTSAQDALDLLKAENDRLVAEAHHANRLSKQRENRLAALTEELEDVKKQSIADRKRADLVQSRLKDLETSTQALRKSASTVRKHFSVMQSEVMSAKQQSEHNPSPDDSHQFRLLVKQCVLTLLDTSKDAQRHATVPVLGRLLEFSDDEISQATNSLNQQKSGLFSHWGR
uniref:GRIP domain-containing protein n=2 Tax=Aureoumbra lagunensis TaxID=44058 RepID=A0A6S8AA86_9STRA